MYIYIILEQQFHISLFVYDVIFSTSSKFLLATIIIVDLVDNNAVFFFLFFFSPYSQDFINSLTSPPD
jgi:hypothetical protein